MCLGNIFGGSKPARVYTPPPPKPDPAIAERNENLRKEGLEQQQKDTRARKQQLQAGLGRRSLLTSSGGGYLSNTTSGNLLS